MKASCTKENLATALSGVSRIVGSTSTLPVLANVLIATDGNRLKLATTNLEVGINWWLGAKVAAEGAITVPARLLTDFVSSLPDQTISLVLEKTSLKVSAEGYQSVLNGIEAGEFPAIPTVKKVPSLVVSAPKFKEALTQVVLVASADDSRPVLNGVLLKTDKKQLLMVATDSYRLAEKKLTLASAPKQPLSLVVPARTLAELGRIISDDIEAVEIVPGENQALFRFGNVEVVSRLIDGQFPDYRGLIPAETPSSVVIDTAEFANLAKVSGLFAHSNAGSVTINIDAKAKLLKMRSIASQVGENTAEAKVEVKGEDAEVALNYRYLADALNVVGSAKVNFAITGKINPCLLKPTDDPSYLHIIMPLRS